MRAGINDKLRGPIWTTLARSMNAALSHNEDLYYKLININDDALDDRINRDIKRTILYTKNKKNIKLNSRKTQIFNILKAYAVYDAEVNYCQGTNFIVALILCYINSERLSFWTFLQLMYEKNWRDLFRTSTPKLMKMMEIFQSNLKTKNSLLYKHFETIEVNSIILKY